MTKKDGLMPEISLTKINRLWTQFVCNCVSLKKTCTVMTQHIQITSSETSTGEQTDRQEMTDILLLG